jgi:hypothetical protein
MMVSSGIKVDFGLALISLYRPKYCLHCTPVPLVGIQALKLHIRELSSFLLGLK